MKALIFSLLASASMFGQAKFEMNKVVGEWTSNGVALDITINSAKNGGLDVVAKSSTSGDEVLVVGVNVASAGFTIETLYEPNDWRTRSRFVMVDDNTMISFITGDGEGEAIYKKVKKE
jgi:hypothetical protein